MTHEVYKGHDLRCRALIPDSSVKSACNGTPDGPGMMVD